MNTELLNHDEIRLLILGRLYEKYYHGGTYTFQQCKNIFSDLIERDENGITGDLVYVKNKNWVDAYQPLNSHMPSMMFINENGIDRYEKAMKIAGEHLLTTEKVPDDLQKDITAGIWDKVDEWMNHHPSLIRVFSKLFVNAMRGDADD